VAPSLNTGSGPPGGDLTGRVLAGRYRLNRPIAAGGMAQVWEATDQTLARRVAVKILHRHLAADDSFVKRFRGEAIAAARLAHPSIVSVYDTVTDGEVDAIVMELVVGTTMRADLDQHGPLQLAAVLAIGTQVADALGAAHASGLVHRDVKPANILLSADGRVLVADFGIAKAAEGADLTSDGSMVGTAKYLAPEQVEGKAVDGRTDLYALGVVLYEALTGTPPFVADTDTGTALARLHRDAVPPRQVRPEIPVAVEHVVVTAMARRPDDRFPDARAMRDALVAAGADPDKAPGVAQAAVRAATGEHPAVTHAAPPPAAHVAPPPVPVEAPGPGPAPAGEPRRGRRRLAAVVVVLAVAAGVAVLARPDGSGGGGRILPVADVRTLDPTGDGEHEGQLPLAHDADQSTAWTTETYTEPDLSKGKGGIGLIVTTNASTDLRQVVLTTTTAGWTAAAYVVDGEPPTDLEGWGDAVGLTGGAQEGTTRIDLGGRTGDAVLVWFTHVGPSKKVRVTEIGIRGG
jgi:tRNA A-37 threonylcarbamoyl transferase component Bud32